MMSIVSLAGAEAHADGRHARRDRNRYAVVDAFLHLVRAGNAHPSVAEVAEHSGLSHRSVFRYFSDRDELVRAAIERQDAFIRPLLVLPIGPEVPFDERTRIFVERRVELFETIAPVARLARTLAATQPLIVAGLTVLRRVLREQIDQLFDAELACLGVDRLAVVAALDVLTSFESVELLRFDQGLDQAAVAHVIETALRNLLGQGTRPAEVL